MTRPKAKNLAYSAIPMVTFDLWPQKPTAASTGKKKQHFQNAKKRRRLLRILLSVLLFSLVVISLSCVVIFLPLGLSFKLPWFVSKKPCEKKLCAFGGVCWLNRTNSEPYCACANDCDSSTKFSPICGSDNVTYNSVCHIRAASCAQQTRIKIRFHGSCSDSHDPCLNKKCAFGAQCIAAADGKTARCMCPERCDNFGDSRDSRPVCGDDGRTYQTLCHMQIESCNKLREIKVKFIGKCDPCRETPSLGCPDGTICKLNHHREPECRCSSNCVMQEQSYVCASDGNAYHSACAMRAEACKQRKDLRVIYTGKCEDGNNPCKDLKCQHGAECFVDIYNHSKCECLMDCEPVWRPVCGKDGVTYDNECELQRIACKNQYHNSVDHKGPCGKGVCRSHQCPYGAVCVERSGLAVCECRPCSQEFAPVCGSNGLTYDNRCRLQYEACKLNESIFVKYEGFCRGCEGKSCDFYSVCVTDGKGNGTCTCPDKCTKTKDVVCGSDGRTYTNECELQMFSCRNHDFLTVAYRGRCDACEKVLCKWGMRCERGRCVCPSSCPKPLSSDEVCGNDGRRYRSECHMLRLACAQGRDITAVSAKFCPKDLEPVDAGSEFDSNNSDGLLQQCNAETCKYAGICQENKQHGGMECVCDLACDINEFEPVCGTDGIIYKNPCLMDLASCRTQLPIYKEDMLQKCDRRCRCNRLGSYSEHCVSDSVNIECVCKPGVAGRRCDSCLPGFWGLHLIAKGNSGCIPCGCSAFGSQRDDCDQSLGRCVCKPGVIGIKCNSCPPNKVLKPQGCIDISTYKAPRSCDEMQCQFGATCHVTNGLAECVCAELCPTLAAPYYANHSFEVCGSDGNTYASLCMLKLFACRLQQDIVVSSLGACSSILKQLGLTSTTMGTDQDSLMKTTRHSWPSSVHNKDKSIAEATTIFPNPLPSAAASNVGDACSRDADCRLVSNSVCLQKHGHLQCTCVETFAPTANSRACARSTPSAVGHLPGASPCLTKPCQNAGTCRHIIAAHGSVDFSCMCPSQFTGRHCEERLHSEQSDIGLQDLLLRGNGRGGACITNCTWRFGDGNESTLYYLPMFAGKSYLQFNRLEDAYTHVTIKIEFKPMEAEGLLLYNGQEEFIGGDFVSLAMVNSHLEFRYDFGDGPIVLRSPDQLPIDRWYKVEASRQGRSGRLMVEGQESVSVTDNGKDGSKSLNLKTPLYLGKVPHMPDPIVSAVGTSYGFMGCVLSLYINGKNYDLRSHMSVDIVKSHMIGECGVNPCSSLPCLSGASCTSYNDTSFKCLCTAQFSGKYCETALDVCASNPCESGGTCKVLNNEFLCICPRGRSGPTCSQEAAPVTSQTVPEFHGESFLELATSAGQFDSEFSAELWLLARKSNGLLFYCGPGNDLATISTTSQSDFISLALVNGFVQLLYNLGSGLANITSPTSLSLNVWHSVHVHRKLRTGVLTVDKQVVARGKSPPPKEKLNLDNYPLFIGGLSKVKTTASSLVGIHQGFDGVIQRLTLNGVPVDDLVQTSILSSGISHYSGPPCVAQLCKNGGTCQPLLNDFECICSERSRGRYCEDVVSGINTAPIDGSRPLSFNGHTFLSYNNKIVESVEGQRDNSFVLRFKTNHSSGLLLWENKGLTVRGDYIVVAIVSGHVVFSYNLGKETKLKQAQSSVLVSDGAWHSLKVWRTKRQGYVSVDNEEPVPILSSSGATELNTDGILWIGGSSKLPIGLPVAYYIGFVGCIGDVRIDSKSLDLVTKHREEKSSVTKLAVCEET